MLKAGLVGTVILLLCYAAWGYALYANLVTDVTSVLFVLAPIGAGFVASWLAPRHQVAVGVLLAIPAACFAVAVNAALLAAGKGVDYFSGASGAMNVASTTLLWAGVLSAVGALIGYLATTARARR